MVACALNLVWVFFEIACLKRISVHIGMKCSSSMYLFFCLSWNKLRIASITNPRIPADYKQKHLLPQYHVHMN